VTSHRTPKVAALPPPTPLTCQPSVLSFSPVAREHFFVPHLAGRCLDWQELMEKGLLVTILDQPGAALLHYRRVK